MPLMDFTNDLSAVSRDSILACLDTLRVGVTLFDEKDRLIYSNEHFRLMFESLGQSIEQDDNTPVTFPSLIRRLKGKAKPGDDTLRTLDDWLDERDRRVQQQDYRPLDLRFNDGRWFQVKERVESESLIRLWVDISDLRKNEIRLEDALSIVDVATAFWDQNDRLAAFNNHFVNVFSTEEAEIKVGDSFADVIDRITEAKLFDMPLGAEQWRNDRINKHRQAFGQDVVTFRDGRDFMMKEHRTRDGGIATVLTDVTTLQEKEREIIHRGHAIQRTQSSLTKTRSKMKEQAHSLVGLNEKLDEAAAQAQQADAVLSTFMRSMSTEIRTPLHSIIGFAEMISRQLFGPVGDDRYREYAELIHLSGHHLLSLVMRILDISKVQMGSYDLNLTIEDIGPILESCLSAMKRSAKDKQIALDLTVAPDLPQLRLDTAPTQVVIREILANAIEFTEPGGTITIDAQRKGTDVEITVRDTGIGIPDEDIDRIMLPFEKGKNARSKDYARGGLGLPLARELAKLQGGRVTLESVAGQGTTVQITFPAAKPNTARGPQRTKVAV